jgi:regulator of protease activity HflC (stomatin/prohibitin superfamily)
VLDLNIILLLALIFGAVILTATFKILPEWERGVVLQLGRFLDIKGPGLILVIPGFQRLIRVDTRLSTMDVQPQDVITRDNVSLKVNAVVYFRVVQPEKAITQVEDYYFATSQLAQTTLRSTLGQYQMDEILSNRDQINHTLQEILDRQTEPWGIKVALVEVKNIDLPKEMQKAMARQAEAERERRAKVISAEAEVERAEKLARAATTLATAPAAIQLAYLQTLTEISNDKSSSIIFPVALQLIDRFLNQK